MLRFSRFMPGPPALALLPLLIALPTAAAQTVRVADSTFDWTDIEQERALFEWSADVVNEQPREVEVRVTLLLLDGDDEVVCWGQGAEERCARDSVDITLEASGERTVRDEGSIPYDRAAEVVSFRFRVDPLRPEEP
ncbi:MAG: hypothetical protein ACOC5E_02860 [Acidobacteriota bacterium]